jgi:hypothetical protein
MAIDLVLQLLDRATEIGALISRAKGEGRDITQAEIDSLVSADDAAKAKLAAAIKAAGG